MERDASEEDAGPELTLAAEEQRELLEAVREVRALMLEGEDAGPLVRDMQERIAVQFDAWASALVASGRSEELCAALASVLGEERARIEARKEREVVVLAARPGLEGVAMLLGDVGAHGDDPRLSALRGKGAGASLRHTRLDRPDLVAASRWESVGSGGLTPVGVVRANWSVDGAGGWLGDKCCSS